MKHKLTDLLLAICVPIFAVVFVTIAIVDLWSTGGEREEE